MLVHAEHLTGSFAAAGLVSGAYAVATRAPAGPLLGRLADRRGQLPVLLAERAASTGAGLGASPLLPEGAPLPR